MEINVKDPQIFFAAFYILSFLAIFIVAVFYAKSRQLPTGGVLLLLTFTTMISIMGSRLLPVPVNEWWNILISGRSEFHHGRSAIGGLLFGLAAFLFSVRFMGLGKQALLIYSVVTPLALGIQKIGCFLNGCCYGISTESVFSIIYPKGTHAHFDHVLNGLISAESLFSHNVFPVQMVEFLVYLFIALLVWQTRKKWKQSLSIIFFCLSLIFLSRFFLEFLRDPSSSPFKNIAYGLRYFQWFLLISCILWFFMLVISEKPLIRKRIFFSQSEIPSQERSLIFILAITILIFSFRGLFTFYEKSSLYLILIPSVFVTAYQFYFTLPRFTISIITTSMLALPLFMIYPTIHSDSVKTQKTKKIYYQNDVKKYKRIDAGTSFGKYYSSVYYNPHEGECGTSYTSEDYEHMFAMFGGGFSVITNKDKYIYTKGINVYSGKEDEHNLTKDEFNSYFIGGINPYVRIDGKWIGGGAGLHVGNLRWVLQNQVEETTFNGGTKSFPVLPEVELRVGRRDILDIKYSYGMNSYATFPVITNEISVGSGFGFKTDVSFRYGRTVSDLNNYQFLSGEWIINKKIGMSAKYHFGSTSNYTWTTGGYSLIEPYKSKGILIFGANYRFGFEK